MKNLHYKPTPEDFTEVVGESLLVKSLEENMSNKFDFLYSPRFWQLCLAGVASGLNVYRQTNDWILGLTTAIGVWLGGSVVVGTVDRTADKKVLAAEISGKTTTVTMPESVSTVTATTN